MAALQFASDTLRSGGHFVCKFYQGAEDKALEAKLKKMFGKVYREKPESSRSVSSTSKLPSLLDCATDDHLGVTGGLFCSTTSKGQCHLG
jgi:hypothetical protein